MRESGVKKFQARAAMASIADVLRLAEIDEEIQVCDLGVLRADGWRAGGKLVPYLSVDWYVEYGREMSRHKKQLNAAEILDAFQTNPFQRERPHYSVLILRSAIYSQRYGTLDGLGQMGVGAVISLNTFTKFWRNKQSECIKTLMMHELGHVFGLVFAGRKESGFNTLIQHCANICVMRDTFAVSDVWETMTRDRLRDAPYCEQCLHDLRQFFR